jgi:hypothetical protein
MRPEKYYGLMITAGMLSLSVSTGLMINAQFIPTMQDEAAYLMDDILASIRAEIIMKHRYVLLTRSSFFRR